MLMPLRNEGQWSHYIRVIEGSNVTMAKIVLENGYGKEDGPSFDGVGGDEQQWGVK